MLIRKETSLLKRDKLIIDNRKVNPVKILKNDCQKQKSLLITSKSVFAKNKHQCLEEICQ